MPKPQEPIAGEQTQEAGVEPTAVEFEAITSQEALDAIVEKRLARVRRKFADYEDLKKRAEDAEKTAAELEEAKSKVAAFEREAQVRSWRAQASKEAGVPADLLRGESLEEITAHAEQIKEYSKRSAGPVIAGIGSNPAVAVSSEQDLIRKLFGN